MKTKKYPKTQTNTRKFSKTNHHPSPTPKKFVFPKSDEGTKKHTLKFYPNTQNIFLKFKFFSKLETIPKPNPKTLKYISNTENIFEIPKYT